MPHTVWTGAINFGLVNVPVKATVATREKRVRFVQLHGEDGERIHYKRTCDEHGEVPNEEIVKGHPVGRDEYVVVTDEELDALAPEKTKTIDIEDFVALSEVDPVYFDKTYHLEPEPTGAKAYRLLVEAMNETGRVAIGRFVMRNKEHLVALRTWGDSLVMEMLHFHDEVTPPEPHEAKAPGEREKEMAVRLVENLSKPFDPAAYHDTHRERLEEFLEAKALGATIKVPEARRGEAIEDLEKALEASLAEVKGR